MTVVCSKKLTPARSTTSARPRASSAGCSAAQCGVYVAPSTPVAPISACASSGPSQRRSSSPNPRLALLVQLGPRPRRLGLAAHQVDGAALGELAVDALGGGAGPDDVDRVLHGPPHGDHGLAAVAAGQRSIGGGEEGRAPAAVATRGAETGHLALEDGDPQGRV